ncbi:hypothetical protein [Terasakiella sp. SH-1]|uniref:hypothetical protein n=1 Tax=Terasakiella sp. SH-1 TaxID=2560057 RepID=UPI00107443AE|nr:hypothetical protein [Terasakiella sp. SH-1]
MTKTTDKQLDNWLDHYKVDTSHTRLKRLEDELLSRVAISANVMFAPMGWKDRLITGIGVCSIALATVLISQMIQDVPATPLITAYSYQYAGY